MRKIGALLGVPPSFLQRHPFPGPGLAVRVLGDVCAEGALDTLREVGGGRWVEGGLGGMWWVVWALCSMQCGVWCVVCGVWCVDGGGWAVEVSFRTGWAQTDRSRHR